MTSFPKVDDMSGRLIIVASSKLHIKLSHSRPFRSTIEFMTRTGPPTKAAGRRDGDQRKGGSNDHWTQMADRHATK